MVNDLLNASFHVLFLTLLSVLSPITALLAAPDSFTSACVEKRRLRATEQFRSFTEFWPLRRLGGRRRMMSWTKFERGSSAYLPKRLPPGPEKINLCLRRCYTLYTEFFSALLQVGTTINWTSYDGKGLRGEAEPLTLPKEQQPTLLGLRFTVEHALTKPEGSDKLYRMI